MGRARFLLCIVGEQTQTSSWPCSPWDHAIYDVDSPKAVKRLMYLKFYEYSTFYLMQNILPFCVIEALD